ncbi:MAG TPA: methyltransferase [Chloroflexota bacterium]|nr:methyltransferase [Chloroflexota bacterium]
MTTPAYLFTDDEERRIQAAEELLDGGTIRVLAGLGLAPGWRCLEVGAGGGSIARWLAGRMNPSGEVVATDLNTQAFDSGAVPGLLARRHDIVRDPLEEDGFDLIHARLVLEHLPERDAVLVKLVRALRPGGWLVLEDADEVAATPVSSLGAADYERVTAVRLHEFTGRGFDGTFARRLPQLLRAQGLVGVGNEGRLWIMEGGSAGARWLLLSLRHLRSRLVGPGKLSEGEMERMLSLLEDPAWAGFSPTIVSAWGQRPA